MMLEELNNYFAHQLIDDFPNGTFVFGEGKEEHPLLMLIGEAPGEQETLQGRPFVGRAGKNLDYFLSVLDFKRDDIYITNAVKFRPTRMNTKGRLSNRPPTLSEQQAFIPWLMAEIEKIAPRLIITLGNTPLRSIFKKDASIGNYHGQIIELPGGRTVFPLYHPAAVIYNHSLMDTYQKDLHTLKMIVSELL